MCGRYYLDTLPETLLEHFSISGVPELVPRFNIAPTQHAPVILRAEDERLCRPARWGLVPFWAKDEKIGNRMINARVETVAEKPAFRAAWKRRRCIVPASGFYEWQKTSDGKQPWAIAGREAPLLGLGGLWERWESPQGEELVSFCILTTRANELMSPIHHRMPVVLEPDAYAHWLEAEDPAQLEDCLQPCEDERLKAWRVSRSVNRPANDEASLLDPVT